MANDDQQPAYDPWTFQLAPLASQHHLSEYSRIKYGHQGCPVPYAPLSLHLPDVVRGLREHQEKNADRMFWWPCPSPAPLSNTQSNPIIPAVKQRAALAAGETIPHPDLQQELSIAISESIPLQPPVHLRPLHPPDSHIKTSESHPINISQIIPPESLIAISSHLIPCKTPRPVLFEICLPYSPDLIAGYPQLHPSHLPPIRLPPIPAASQSKYLSSKQIRSSVSGALNAALTTKLSLSPLPVSSSKFLLSLKRTFKSQTTSDDASEHDVSDPIPFPSSQTAHAVLTLPASYALHPFPSHARPPTAPSPPSKMSRFRTPRSSSTLSSRHGPTSRKPLKLGNLFLSSCPGKKVRLTGPVRGRSGVCRDLATDLRRMRMLGARCVVCCLDDEELEFLIGASWAEYCQTAHQEGLDVLRLPIPEGLVPLSPKALDAHLDRIIGSYTIHGTSVLVHCRGGVGRAGLFACCWMLRLGLCGWIETDITSSATATTPVSKIKRNDIPSELLLWNSETVVRRDTLQMVERVIEVVRRRRSVKAIETLEQVQFLVEFVDYLRACGHASDDSGNPQSTN